MRTSMWAPVSFSCGTSLQDWSSARQTHMLGKTNLTLTKSSKGASIHSLVCSSPPSMVARGQKSHHLMGKSTYPSTLQGFEFIQTYPTCAPYLQLLFQEKLIEALVCSLDLQ